MSEFTELIRHWASRRPDRLAMATVVRTAGSTYRKAGARMLVGKTGPPVGLISGGCLEEDVARRARETLHTGRAALHTYDTRAQFGCNGAVDVLVEPLDASGAERLFSIAQICLKERKTLVSVTVFAAPAVGAPALGSYPLLAEGRGFPEAASLPPAMVEDARLALRDGYSLGRGYPLDRGTVQALLQPIRPPLQLYVFGAGPDTFPLGALAAQLGWNPTLIIHPAQPPPRLPERCGQVIAGPDEIPAGLTFDARTAAVVMTHHYGRDLAYLARLLPLRLPYLGLLGPRARREQLLGELLGSGAPLAPHHLSALHGPAGLDLGADTPEEIALAILAEIKATFSGRTGGVLRDSRQPIHAPSSREAEARVR